MKELYGNVYDKINMDLSRKNEIRNVIENKDIRKGSALMKVRWAAVLAIVLGIAMSVPQVRAAAMEGVNYVVKLFNFADGTNIKVTTYEDSTEAEISSDDTSYIEVDNGRLYFILDDVRQDITDKVSATKYFRYEKKLSDGGRAVILVGGEEKYGWIELLFDKNGNYISNRMDVPTNDDWVEISMYNEGVPTGNPYYDRKNGFIK